ncbi:MAG: DUF262 domain-containing HNH endonuclease family protein [Hyphomicrobiales bacterium]|nr:DUF262 domain-containing HNH endonuclease family protein [Hyphomicrobiales bacterium]
MAASFETNLISLENLLSGRATFTVPAFQRPYSWENEIAAQLFDDLQTRFKGAEDGKEVSEFFLGSIILCQTGSESYQIIDGQQRLLTIAMILAVARDLIVDSSKQDALQKHLWVGNVLRGGNGKSRISIRKTEDEIFQQHIIKIGGTTQLPRKGDTDAANRIISVVKKIRSEVEDPRERYISSFVDFILSRCQFIRITASSIEAGYTIFRSVNSPGQKLTEFDIVRAELIGPKSADPDAANNLSAAWSKMEIMYGSKELARYIKAVGSTVITDGYKTDLIHLVKVVHSDICYKNDFYNRLDGFFRNYQGLTNASVDFGYDSTVINRTIKCLLFRKDDDWRALALLWLTQGNGSNDTYRFFRGLDALFLGLSILGPNKTVRAKRIVTIQNGISEQTILGAASPLFLTPEEKQKIRQGANGELRSTMNFIKPLLLRLSAEMTDTQADIYFPKNLTLEHILPRKPAQASQWIKDFTFDDRVQLTNSLGNFALLTEKINPAASNSDWSNKKKIIFGNRSNQSFPITNSLVKYEVWTPETIKRRQRDLLSLLDQIISV